MLEIVGGILLNAILFVPGFVFVWRRTFAHFGRRSAVFGFVVATIAGLCWPVAIVIMAIARIPLVDDRRQIQRQS